MFISLLIMHVQVFPVNTDERCLISREAILHYNGHILIKIPQGSATAIQGGPVIGERYIVRYVDGIAHETCPPEFCFMGNINQQLVFSTAPVQHAEVKSPAAVDQIAR